jgi:hypothetical protein
MIEAEAKTILAKILADFTLPAEKKEPISDGPNKLHLVELPQSDFLAPDLLVYVLHRIMGFPKYGPREKMHWGISFAFQGSPCQVECRKFGMCLILPDRQAHAPIHKALLRACQIDEQALDEFARREIEAGRVIVPNHYRTLGHAYGFFRNLAKEAYERPDRKLETGSQGGIEFTRWTFLEGPMHGSFLTTGMLDAYFSRLEHLMILLLAFSKRDVGNHALMTFIKSNWKKKFKAILDISSDRKAKELYDRLNTVKERFRNTLAHGLLDRGGGSLWLWMPDVGQIPANMVEHRKSLKFVFVPIEKPSFDMICELFDEIDNFLASSHTRYGYKYARTGLSVSFFEDARAEYHLAMSDDLAFDEMVQRHVWDAERVLNLDY